MNDNEFITQSDAVLQRIDQAIENAGLDVDALLQSNVLQLEFDNGDKIIVNRHEAQHEMWIAAKSGGYHFAWRDGEWRSTRDDTEFFSTLAEAISAAAGELFQF